MTWPGGIAIAVGLTTIALLTYTPHHQRSTTKPNPETEADDGHHPHRQDDNPRCEARREEDGAEQGPGEEDRGPEAGR